MIHKVFLVHFGLNNDQDSAGPCQTPAPRDPCPLAAPTRDSQRPCTSSLNPTHHDVSWLVSAFGEPQNLRLEVGRVGLRDFCVPFPFMGREWPPQTYVDNKQERAAQRRPSSCCTCRGDRQLGNLTKARKAHMCELGRGSETTEKTMDGVR